MPDKSTSSEATQAAAPETVSAARKIYSIVKYGDPILEKSTTPITKFDAELEQLTEDMFAARSRDARGRRRRIPPRMEISISGTCGEAS